jgi:hypothetical protein
MDMGRLLPSVATPKPLCPYELDDAPQSRESFTEALMKVFVQQPVVALVAAVGMMTPVARPLRAQFRVGDAHRFPAAAASRLTSRHPPLIRASDTLRRLDMSLNG